MTSASRLFHVLAGVSAVAAGMAQCGPYKYHPLWPDTLGSAHVDIGECTNATSVLWDNGDTNPSTYDLPAGPHMVTFFEGTTPVDSNAFTIEQQYWEFSSTAMGNGSTLTMQFSTEVDRCEAQIFNGLDCHPLPAQTVLRLLQDGIPIDSTAPWDCLLATHSFQGLPFGHTYWCDVVSTGACPSYGQGPPTTAYDCSGFSMDIQTQDDQGDGTGSIVVTELIPAAPGPFTPPSPVTGHYMVFDENMNPIGDMQTGTPAEWGALVAGSYTVYFISDTLCSPVMMTVVIDNTSGIAAGSAVSPVLWPIPATNTLHWSGNKPSRIQVLDAVGRTVLSARGIDRIDVSLLAPGSYWLRLDDDPPWSFIKR